VKTPDGLNAGATLPTTEIKCQCYFADRRFQLQKPGQLFIRMDGK
jgi:hypothetical protein